MNLHEPDEPLRQLFSEQREADQQRAPSFQQSWLAAATLAQKPARRPWTLPVAVGAVAALVAAAAAARLWSRTPSSPPPPTPTVIVSLAEWTSPTDFLLEPLSESSLPGWQP